LIAKKLAGEASEEDLEQLQALMKKYPDVTYPMELLSDLWKPAEEKEPAEDAFTRHLVRMDQWKARVASHERFVQQQAAWNRRSEKRGLFSSFFNGYSMLLNYGKIIRRNLVRNKAFSLINISGLAIGMASAILILLWIQNELSFDQFHVNRDRIYQLYSRAEFDGQTDCWGKTPMVMAPVIKTNYQQQVEEVVRLNWVGAFVFSNGDKHLETYGYLADPGFFKLFSFPLIRGDAETALSSTHSVVLTECLAKKLFGDVDVLGKEIRVDSTALFTVTGVLKDLPGNTQFRFEYLIPWSYTKEVGWNDLDWGNTSIRTYVLLKPGISEKAANDCFRHIIQSHAGDIKNEVFVHPMRKWWLYSDFENGKIAGGQIETIRLFGIIAGFILLIACINYMNLSTARSEKRAREVGIRKMIGAGKASLVWRFLGESVLFALLAGIIALIIVQPGLSWFNDLVLRKLFIPYTDLHFWLIAVGFTVFTGLVAGSYPAFYLSGFRPMSVLKGHFKNAYALVAPRKILVVVQFTFAIAFIICTIMIYRQIRYGQKRDSGYDRNNLAFVYIKGDTRRNYALIRNELINSGAVTSVTRSNSPITDIWTSEDTYQWAGKDPNTRTVFAENFADNNFAGTIGLKLIAGRDIDLTRYPDDSAAILLNETAARMMGFKNPIGQPVKSKQGNWHVIGVIKNFIPESPYEPVPPMIIQGPKYGFGTVTFRLNTAMPAADNLKKIGAIFTKYNPDYPFRYWLVDKEYREKFQGEQHIGELATLFAGLTIFISCLGLFALATYMAENRIREIGVRKVLGASVSGITTLLSKDFLKLVLISFVIASPLAWWGMHAWLQNYAYRVDLSWWVFALTGFFSLIIAGATVSYQAIKAALASPVKSLRTE
jgi:putative ABC transport system permease protein